MKMEIIKPTSEHMEWADCEIGVIIHFDVPVYKEKYYFRHHFGDVIPPDVFNPTKLDTDQWLSAAKALGAKYAVLVAKHCTGFSLWPTSAHEYSVKSSPFKNGEGDIVRDFFESCKKFDIRPGLYCSASCNQYLSVDNPGRVISGDPEEQKEYNNVVMTQLRELWTNYGKLFEIWFDGGVMPVAQGGPDVASLLKELQPDAVVFGGPGDTKSLIRWVGNELGEAPEDCSSLAYGGQLWCPAESDFPNRFPENSDQSGWFWREAEDDSVLTGEQLFGKYLTTVGRNTNMLVGMVINTDGEFPARDAVEFARAGEIIRSTFDKPLAVSEEDSTVVTLPKDTEKEPKYLVMRENIAEGERVKGYTVHAYDKEGLEIFTHNGQVISHKRILDIPAETVKVKLEITDSVADPKLLPIEIY